MENSSNIKVDQGSEKSFGYVFSIVFTIIGLYPLISSSPMHLWALGIAATLLLITLLKASILSKPNYLWFKFGIFLGSIVSPIVMGLVFITTIVPMGLIMKLLRKDALTKKLDKSAKSYWIKRETPPQPMKHQF